MMPLAWEVDYVTVKSITSKLRALTGWRKVITPDTDVIYDIRLTGTDLMEFLDWITEVHGVDFAEVGPRDWPLDDPPDPLFTLFKREKNFRGLSVGALLRAIQRKRWTFA